MTPFPFPFFLPPTPTPLRWGAFLPSWTLAPSLVARFLFLLVVFRPLPEDDAQGKLTGVDRTTPPRDFLLFFKPAAAAAAAAPLPPDRFGFRVSTTEATDEDADPSVTFFKFGGALMAGPDRRAGVFPDFFAGAGTSERDCCAESAVGHPAAGYPAAATAAAAEAEVEEARATPSWRLESTLLLHPSAAIRWDGFLPPLRGPTPQEDCLVGTAVPAPAVHETGRV